MSRQAPRSRPSALDTALAGGALRYRLGRAERLVRYAAAKAAAGRARKMRNDNI